MQPTTQQFTRKYLAGTVLFHENDPGEHMYVIQTGQVKIFRQVGQTEIVLALLGPGEFFGEMALLEQQPRSASAEVITDSVMVLVDQETFEDIIRNNSEIALRIMRKLSARVREADQRIQNLMLESGLGRMLEVLRGLIPHATREDGRFRIPASITCTLPQRTGLSMAATESVLERLDQSGMVKRQDDGSLVIQGNDTFDEYGEYLELKQRFDPLTAAELSEISGLSEGEVHQVIQRILDEHMSSTNDNEDEVSSYRRYLRLKQRFEYSDQQQVQE